MGHPCRGVAAAPEPRLTLSPQIPLPRLREPERKPVGAAMFRWKSQVHRSFVMNLFPIFPVHGTCDALELFFPDAGYRREGAERPINFSLLMVSANFSTGHYPAAIPRELDGMASME